MPDSDVGSYFGKYFLLKKLAAGGMGEVFLAKQQGPAGFEKILVVKKVLPHLTENKEFVELFLGEARLSARMNHRNIVQVFELGEETGTYFIAMEYVQGKGLRDVLDRAKERREKIPAEIARSIAEQICDGCSYAHNLCDASGRGLNLVHRDLNPQNVLISYTGDVKVIDFGIAKSEMSTVKTEAGMIKGKFVYMSPEQSLAKKLDKRSDIFAVGITLYEMLTGINPFHKNNIVLSLEAVQRFDPPPPSEYEPSYAPFDPIIAKAMAKDRDRRYSDAAEMQDDLRRIVLPRAAERVGQFVSRLFRVELEAEQKVLMDTDANRISQAAKVGRTPARPAPRPPPSTLPEQPSVARAAPAENNDGATMMLAQPANQVTTGQRKVAATPARSVPAPRPPPRAPAPPPRPVQQTITNNGDTMIDGESPIDDPALQAAIAKARENMGAPASRKPVPISTEIDGGPHRPSTPPPRKAPVAPPPGGRQTEEISAVPGTLQVGPEAAAVAKRDALAKAAAQKAAAAHAHGHSFAHPKKPGKKLALIVGGACAVAVLVIVGAIWALFSDDAGDKKKAPQKRAAVVSEEDTAEKKPEKKEEAKAAAPKKEEPAEKKEAKATQENPAPKEEKKKPADKGIRVVASKSELGKLVLNAAGAPVWYGDYRASGMKNSITDSSGTITVGDDNTPFKVTLHYTVQGKELVLRADSKPFSIVAVDDGPTKGKTPVADIRIEDKLTKIEFKKPGAASGMTLRLRFSGN